ncbi:MAG: cryptochrome/photolyase family protein [Pirellulales bacterium]
MRTAYILYPHQLYSDSIDIAREFSRATIETVYLVEDPLFFTQYAFHKHKLILHRASMSAASAELQSRGLNSVIVRCDELSSSGDLAARLRRDGFDSAVVIDPCDDWLLRRLVAGAKRNGLDLQQVDDPHWITSREQFSQFRGGRKRLFFTEFYIQSRQRENLLLDDDGKPVGGKWSYDTENRKKLPKQLNVPMRRRCVRDSFTIDAIQRVDQDFPNAPGASDNFDYPVTREQALLGLNEFITERLDLFGDYEDAMDAKQTVLFHSLLTPALNTGLLTPREVIDAAIKRADEVSLPSLEGFVRQVIGWREYMRHVYLDYGRDQRTCNFWNHTRRIPASFYDASTRIEPLDIVIGRVLRGAYCHHIERLMILGNFMMLCEFLPHDVYRWFMELFIDAYDWVMVPNVYGMSQHSDGGRITTKPYISGSSYVLRMSNFRRGDWCEVWDALYWRFISKHREFFLRNPRMAMMVRQADKMGAKLERHIRTADDYLKSIDDAVKGPEGGANQFVNRSPTGFAAGAD